MGGGLKESFCGGVQIRLSNPTPHSIAESCRFFSASDGSFESAFLHSVTPAARHGRLSMKRAPRPSRLFTSMAPLYFVTIP
jgi:hypothetical protein